MKNRIAKAITQMPPSGIREFFDLVLGMKDVISLGVGEPDFSTPWNICESAIYSIEQGITSYTSNSGMLELRKLISADIYKRTGVRYDPATEILITVGVSEALDLVMRTILEPGEKVIIPAPCYVSYGPMTSLAGGQPVYLPTTKEEAFKINPEKLDRLIDKKTKALLLNFPSNPTGASYTEAELKQIRQVAEKHDVLVITDEIYDILTYDTDHHCFVNNKKTKEYSVYLNGFSKAHAMTGWRIGYAAAPADIIGGMTKIHQYSILCAPIAAQIAACEALKHGMEAANEMKKDYNRRRKLIVAELNRLGLECHMPEGSFYVFPSIKHLGIDSVEFCTKLLKQENVAVIPGSAFGECGNGHVRMCYAIDTQDIKEAIKRIERFLTTL